MAAGRAGRAQEEAQSDAGPASPAGIYRRLKRVLVRYSFAGPTQRVGGRPLCASRCKPGSRSRAIGREPIGSVVPCGRVVSRGAFRHPEPVHA